jgi:two-component sensor histidine kinase
MAIDDRERGGNRGMFGYEGEGYMRGGDYSRGRDRGDFGSNYPPRESYAGEDYYHRVKNNLQLVSSLLSMQARSLSDAATREALNDSRKRVQSIALIHDELYQAQDFSHVAFSEYIRRLCTLVVQATSPSVDRVSLKLDLHSVALGIDRAIPCGLILNELLINSMKHGFADGRSGAIHVELREPETNRIELTVADNGVGLPDGLDVRQAQTVGMQIVCTLAEQLDAVLDVQRRGGTTFKLGFFGAS